MKAFEGDSLVWENEVLTPVYVPDTPIIPPWVNENIQYIDETLTYVDGEWVNLELIEIKGDSTVTDIDMNKDGIVPKHEILVYFAKLTKIAQDKVDFKINYLLQARVLR